MAVSGIEGMPPEIGLPGNDGSGTCNGVIGIHHAEQAAGGYGNWTYGRGYEGLCDALDFVCPVATAFVGCGKQTGYTYRGGYGQPHAERDFPSCNGKQMERTGVHPYRGCDEPHGRGY